MNTRPLSNALARNTRELCERLYEERGLSAVYSYCNRTGQKYHPCGQCEADTPTISDRDDRHTCALCGTSKAITNTRATYRKARPDRFGNHTLFVYPVTVTHDGTET